MLPFPDYPEATIDKSQHEIIEQRKERMLNSFMLREVTLTGPYDMPVVSACNNFNVPDGFIASHEAKSSPRHDVGVLFYEYDYLFDRVWNDPYAALLLLKQFPCAIGTDFSQFLNMPFPARIWNNYRNKLMMAWFQANDLTIIPNVTWSDPSSYDYCFDGMPRHSIIAINSLGAKGNTDSTYFWQKGYEEALRRLEPIKILRYGEELEGEDMSITVRIVNPFTSGMNNGR